jgi:hypothetical protein
MPLEHDRDRDRDCGELSARPFFEARSICAIIVTVLQALTTDLVGRRTLFLGSVVVTWVVLLIVGGMGLIPNKSAALNKLVVSACTGAFNPHWHRCELHATVYSLEV